MDKATCFSRNNYPAKFSSRLEQTECLYQEVHAEEVALVLLAFYSDYEATVFNIFELRAFSIAI